MRTVPAFAGDGDASMEVASKNAPVAPAFSRNQPPKIRLLLNRRLNEAGSTKETRQIVFDLRNTG